MLRLKKLGHRNFFEIWGTLREQLYRTPEYQQFLKEVRARSSYMCAALRCTRKGRHVHHKIRVYEDPTKAVDPDNGIFLCVPCHKKEHKGMKISATPSSKVSASK